MIKNEAEQSERAELISMKVQFVKGPRARPPRSRSPALPREVSKVRQVRKAQALLILIVVLAHSFVDEPGQFRRPPLGALVPVQPRLHLAHSADRLRQRRRLVHREDAQELKANLQFCFFVPTVSSSESVYILIPLTRAMKTHATLMPDQKLSRKLLRSASFLR